MNNYLIRYIDTEGSHSKCHINADSKEDARSQIRREYWDIDEITSIQKR